MRFANAFYSFHKSSGKRLIFKVLSSTADIFLAPSGLFGQLCLKAPTRMLLEQNFSFRDW